ncbi:MAG TPA: NADH-quinone oxidoreductase subunit N [Gemmataceae bacterium]|nr:NADH-quinone oxidoreductase subunit N [Gemmataceae bacterium]
MNPNLVAALTGYVPYLVPEMILGTAACVLFLGGTWRTNRHLWGGAALAALLAAGLALMLNPLPHFASTSAARAATYASPVVLDRLALLLRAVSIAGGIILVLFCWDAMPEKRAADFHACLLLMVAGMGLSGAANELITLFLALELTSIPTYLILYIGKQAQPEGGIDEPAQEAALKYFLLSVFSSALTLFGFSYLYGLAGTTNLPGLADAFRRASQLAPAMETVPPSPLTGMGMVALVMVVAGLGFRLTAVPFHFYAPDVYQGTTTANAAILAFVPKVAGFAALVRVLGFVMPILTREGFTAMLSAPILSDQLPVLLWIMAAVTMTLGNLLGLLQDNLRRLLAYSSVAHAGYMLIGLAVAPKLRAEAMVDGVDAVFFYLVAYGSMTIGAFGVLHYLSTSGQQAETVDDLAGLSRTRPGMALLMILFLFSLIGIPLTAGFMGKFLLFAGALDVPASVEVAASLEQRWLFITLAILAAINAAIGGWYYLRIAAVMYLREPPPTAATLAARGQRSWPVLVSVWLCAVLTLGIGVYPAPLKKAVQAAVPRPSDIVPPRMAEQSAASERNILADAAEQ